MAFIAFSYMPRACHDPRGFFRQAQDMLCNCRSQAFPAALTLRCLSAFLSALPLRCLSVFSPYGSVTLAPLRQVADSHQKYRILPG
jgi:hypothetical protein